MSDEKKEKEPFHPETSFLPPLKMFLAFFDKESRQKKQKQEDSDEKKVEKLIEKLSEKEEEKSKK
jgi:electron transfer flavoprotein alpha/beta subunit